MSQPFSLQRLGGEEAEVPAAPGLQLGQVDLQVLAGGGSYGRFALEEAVAGSGRQDAPVGALLLAVCEDHAFGQFAVVREAAEEGRVVERMHDGDRGAVGSQQVAAWLEGLDLVSERLEHGPPGEALGTRDRLDNVRQMARVGRLGQAFAQEVGGEEILNPQTGNDSFFKAAELSSKECRGFARRPGAALFQQVEYAVGEKLADGAGELRAGDQDFVWVVGGGQGYDRVGLAALSGLPQAAEGGFAGSFRRPKQMKGGGFPGRGRAVRARCPGAAGAEGGFEWRGDGGWAHGVFVGSGSGLVELGMVAGWLLWAVWFPLRQAQGRLYERLRGGSPRTGWGHEFRGGLVAEAVWFDTGRRGRRPGSPRTVAPPSTGRATGRRRVGDAAPT